MNIVFDEIAKVAMLEMIKSNSEDYIRIKAFRGCGKPAYEIYSSFKGQEDMDIVVNEVPFVFLKDDEKLINGIEIKYDKDVYNNGFYIKSI